MAINIDYIDGRLTPIKSNVIVTDMYFGEQKTSSGLIITSDDGDVRGIYPHGQRYMPRVLKTKTRIRWAIGFL